MDRIQSGFKPIASKVSPDVEKRIKSQLRAGKGIFKVARELGLGTSTVQRIAREMGRFDVRAFPRFVDDLIWWVEAAKAQRQRKRRRSDREEISQAAGRKHGPSSSVNGRLNYCEYVVRLVVRPACSDWSNSSSSVSTVVGK